MADPRIDAPPHVLQLPRMLWVVVTVLLALGLVTFGVSFADATSNRSQSRAQQAQTNRQTCLAVSSERWRNAISKVIVASIDEDGDLLRNGRDDLELALLEGQQINDLEDPLCPFFPGRPDLTPKEPRPLRTTTTEPGG